MNNTYCFSPAGFKLQVIAALVASAISGGVQAQATVNTTGGTENDVAVNVNTDDQSAGAFIVYSGSGTTNVMASIGALTGTTFSALTGGTAASPGPVGGQLQITSTGVDVSVGALTVAGDAVATEDFVISQGYATTSAMNTADSGLQTQIDNRVVIGSSATLNGLNNSGGGITSAGAISGATSISASGTISGATVSGTTLTDGVATLTGGNLSGVGTISSTTINNSGTTTTSALSVTNNAGVGGNLSVTGTTTTAGINNNGTLNQVGTANINASGTATTNVGTGGGNTNIGAAGSTNTILGTTNINTSGSAGTQIGNFGNSATIHGSNIYLDTINTHLYMDSGNVMLSNTSGQNYSGVSATNAYIQSGSNSVIVDATGTAVTGGMSVDSGGGTTELTVGTGTISVAGSTSINNNVNSATSINTGTSTGSVTIGNAANTTSLNSSINNIGTSVGYASTNNIGNTNAGTTTNAMGGNSSVALSNNSGSLSVASGGSYTVSNTQAQTAFGANTLTVDATHINGTVGGGSINVTNTSTTIGNAGGGSFTSTATPNIVGVSGPALIAGDAASQANVAGASYVNRLQGNTLVDGNMYINGTLVYTSNSSASTTVTSGASILSDATQSTNGQMTIVNTGGTGAAVDQNGKITTGIVDQSTASLTLTNGVGNTHGLVVTETQATLSGGTNSTSLTMNDNGARFSNSANGAPVKVTGVADGTGDFDAVNFRQLKGVAAGVAGTSAMANIPQVDQSKRFAVGLGLGNFQSMTAVALGASYRASENIAVRVSASTVGGVKKSTVVGAGIGVSW